MTVRKLTTVAATLALTLALGACGDKKDKADPGGTPSASTSTDAEPSDAPKDAPGSQTPAANASAGEIVHTTGDAKAAFNTFFKAISTGNGSVLCGFLDDGTMSEAPPGFDCPTLIQVSLGSAADELKPLSGITVKSVTTSGDKACISLKDLKIDVAAIAALLGEDGVQADDTPMCMSNASGHWTVVDDSTSN